MKIGNQQIEGEDLTAYSETMRGLPIADNQDPFDTEIGDALDQLGRIYDILGDKPNRTKRSKSIRSSNSLSIGNALKMK